MSNTLKARLSKLVYAPLPNDGAIAQAGSFDRLILLLRRIYQAIDEEAESGRITLQIRCGGRQGRITLNPAPPEADSGSIRLKRWTTYLHIAEQVPDSGGIAVSLVDIESRDAAVKTALTQTVNRMITALGLDKPVADHARKIPSIITHRGKSLSRINTQLKTENYAGAQSKPSSRFSTNSYKLK